MKPFTADVFFIRPAVIGEHIPAATGKRIDFIPVRMELVRLSDLMKELGVEPLPVGDVVRAVVRERGLPFCVTEMQYLNSRADEVFILPVFTHIPSQTISAFCICIEKGRRPPARFCALRRACERHHTAPWDEISDLTVIVPATTDLATLIMLFSQIISLLAVFHETSAPEGFLPPHTLILPHSHTVDYRQALKFVKYVEAKGGITEMVRDMSAKLAVEGQPARLIECNIPFNVVTVDKLLRKPTLQV
jgi:hypothetical protein